MTVEVRGAKTRFISHHYQLLAMNFHSLFEEICILAQMLCNLQQHTMELDSDSNNKIVNLHCTIWSVPYHNSKVKIM